MALCKHLKGYALLCIVLTYGWIAAAVVFSGFSLASCAFVKSGTVDYGLYRQGASGQCLGGYEDGFDHGWLHAWAAICGALAPILGVIMILFMLLDFFCKVCCRSALQSLILSGAELSQAFTFLLYASDACISTSKETGSETVLWGGCKVGKGSAYSCIAFGCYILAGCFHCIGPRPDPPFCRRDDGALESPRAREEGQELTTRRDEEDMRSRPEDGLR